MSTRQAAIFETDPKLRRALVQGLRKAGVDVTPAQEPGALRGEGVVLLGPSVTPLGRRIREVREAKPGALVLVARTGFRPAAGADAIVPLPLSPADLRVRLPEIERLRKGTRKEVSRPRPRPGEGILDLRTGFYTFEHFKEVLFVEVKRSRRYGFPLSIALVELDPLPPPPLDAELSAQIFGALALAIRRSLRDTDYPVQYGPEKVLLLMPHTELTGALSVTRRLCERVAKSTLTQSQRVMRPSVSVGVAAADIQGHELSFADLARRATQGLVSAQAAGGNRVDFYDVAAVIGGGEADEEPR